MSRPSALPLYLQLSEMLTREIAAGHLPDGSKLPTEKTMAEEMGVAVGTLRKALKHLEDRGLVHRIQGSGNYIRAKHDPQSVYAMLNLELYNGGGLPTADILSVDRLEKPSLSKDHGPSPDGHRIRRLRYLSETPVAVEEIWLDGSFTKKIEKSALSDSLYLYYKNVLGLIIARAEDRVGIGTSPDWTPNTLGGPGRTLCYIERFAWSQSQEGAEFSRTWFDPEKARYISRMS